MRINEIQRFIPVVLVGAMLTACGFLPAAGEEIPKGSLSPAQIMKQPYQHDGSGKTSLVSDPKYGKVLQTSIKGSDKRRSEYKINVVGSHVDMEYEFRARYISGKGSLINQRHQPTSDHQGNRMKNLKAICSDESYQNSAESAR